MATPTNTPVRTATPAAVKHAVSHAHHSLLPHWLTQLGGLGLFAVAILDSSPIPLPLPGSTDLLLLLLVSHHGNPFLLAACAIAGSAIGGYLTWSAGKKGGEALMERSVPARFRKRIEQLDEPALAPVGDASRVASATDSANALSARCGRTWAFRGGGFSSPQRSAAGSLQSRQLGWSGLWPKGRRLVDEHLAGWSERDRVDISSSR